MSRCFLAGVLRFRVVLFSPSSSLTSPPPPVQGQGAPRKHYYSTTTAAATTTAANMAAAARTYDDALSRLPQLQSNAATIALFADASAGIPGGAPSLNARAKPETLAWLARAGYKPSDLSAAGLKCVHIAGTKGKGSVTALVAGILSRYPSVAKPVGVYTSPHLVSVRERIVIDGEPISREKFGRYFFELWDRFTEAARAAGDADPEGPNTKPFYFRFLTILAVHVFLREGVRSAVVECGIGGEYDPTTFVLPDDDGASVTAAVVTQLGLDHVSMLGDTVEKIAWNKAGVFKKGVLGVTRRLEERPGVMGVLRDRAREKGCELREVRDEDVEAWKGVDGARLEGPFQRYNMALAVVAARQHLMSLGVKFEGEFGRDGYSLDATPEEFVVGLREASLRGRCETFVNGKGVEWFADGAHTEDSLAGVGEWFAGKIKGDDNVVPVLVFNQQDRDPVVLLTALMAAAQNEVGGGKAVFKHAIFTRNEEKAVNEPDLVVQQKACETLRNLSPDTEATIQTSVQPSVELVRAIAQQAREDGKTCKVLVTGSFHLVGAILKTVDDSVEY
ncbi:Mur ligase [Podospora didyma]|uniref:Folylpolyglutamate synthase n=1 Tax=Podospora didyma TaxID=330526 RepID=A0AAE0P5Y1_9PEZI|nr:Mur ligase [Podospora didyma]